MSPVVAARLLSRSFADDQQRNGPSNASRDRFGVKAASNVYPVSVSHGLYVTARTYESGCTTWWCRLLESIFLPCSFARSLNLLDNQHRHIHIGRKSLRRTTMIDSLRRRSARHFARH